MAGMREAQERFPDKGANSIIVDGNKGNRSTARAQSAHHGRMPDPRDYQRFLRASAGPKTSMRSMVHLLPAPPPAATLWSQGGLLAASALLPLVLWMLGRLAPLDVVLLYLAEGASYGGAVVARVALTAAPPAGDDERPRLATAVFYAIRYGAVWSGLALVTLACIAPKPAATAIGEWLVELLMHFGDRTMWLPALATTAFLWLDVARRSDYIDAYLELGPRETARYGYVYPFALIFLLGSALASRLVVTGGELDSGGRGAPLMPPAFLAFWLIGWRTLMQLSNLTLPLWGRGLARFEGRFEQAMQPELTNKSESDRS
jgi:hypothetical protein